MSKHKVTVKSELVMGMPVSTARCSCSNAHAFFPVSSKEAGYRNEYDAARDWKCPDA